jgi:hypothetical protein
MVLGIGPEQCAAIGLLRKIQREANLRMHHMLHFVWHWIGMLAGTVPDCKPHFVNSSLAFWVVRIYNKTKWGDGGMSALRLPDFLTLTNLMYLKTSL